MTDHQLTTREDGALLSTDGPMEPMQILAKAVIAGELDAETLERLSALVERHEDRSAAKEFAAAMAEFRRRCPEIKKSTSVSNKHGEHMYYYVKIHHIQRVVDPLLDELGLSYWWDSETDADRITTVCNLEHISGHSRSASFEAPNNQGTNAMSAAQKAAAGKNFARRQTLIDVLGLTTADVDDDAVPQDDSPVTQEQAATLLDLSESVGADVGRFCVYMRIANLSDLPAREYDRAVMALKAKGTR